MTATQPLLFCFEGVYRTQTDVRGSVPHRKGSRSHDDEKEGLVTVCDFSVVIFRSVTESFHMSYCLVISSPPPSRARTHTRTLPCLGRENWMLDSRGEAI